MFWKSIDLRKDDEFLCSNPMHVLNLVSKGEIAGFPSKMMFGQLVRDECCTCPCGGCQTSMVQHL
jgi:hypothetical protein